MENQSKFLARLSSVKRQNPYRFSLQNIMQFLRKDLEIGRLEVTYRPECQNTNMTLGTRNQSLWCTKTTNKLDTPSNSMKQR